jgi:hypothetical protein
MGEQADVFEKINTKLNATSPPWVASKKLVFFKKYNYHSEAKDGSVATSKPMGSFVTSSLTYTHHYAIPRTNSNYTTVEPLMELQIFMPAIMQPVATIQRRAKQDRTTFSLPGRNAIKLKNLGQQKSG